MTVRWESWSCEEKRAHGGAEPIGNAGPRRLMGDLSITRRMFKKALQHGCSKRRSEMHSFRYVELLSAARTKLAGFFNIALEDVEHKLYMHAFILHAVMRI